jgi:hypothetical protein
LDSVCIFLWNSLIKTTLGNSPLKGKSRKKTPLHSKKYLFFCLALNIAPAQPVLPPFRARYFFPIGFLRNSPESHQSPIGIKANVVLNQMIQTLPLVQSIGLQKIFGTMPCSFGCITNLMVFNQPHIDSRHRRIRIKRLPSDDVWV